MASSKIYSIFKPNLFKDKVAIVTGGGTGIGKAITTELLYLDTSNEENTDTECAASVTNLFTNDTSSETSVTVNDQENSLPSATKKPESNTMTSHKNKLNITAESMDIMTDIAKARKEAIEEENKLFLEFKRTEHMAAMVSLRKDEEYKKLQHQMLVQEHTIKVQLLSAKLEHYQLLNSQIKQNMQAFK